MELPAWLNLFVYAETYAHHVHVYIYTVVEDSLSLCCGGCRPNGMSLGGLGFYKETGG